MTDLLRKFFLTRINTRKLKRFIIRKYLSSILKKFNSKLHTIKKKFEGKKKRKFFTNFFNLSQIKFEKTSRIKNSLRKMMNYYMVFNDRKKFLNIFFKRWKAAEQQLKELLLSNLEKVIFDTYLGNTIFRQCFEKKFDDEVSI
jgi:hypothetical protein